MIKVQLPTRMLAVGFSHPLMQEMQHPERGSLVAEVIKVRHSHCTIVELDPKDDKKFAFLTEGVARCSPLDHFVKEKGRRVALHNALLDTKIIKDSKGRPKKVYASRAGFNKEERKLIWEAYFNRRDLPSVPFSKMNEVTL